MNSPQLSLKECKSSLTTFRSPSKWRLQTSGGRKFDIGGEFGPVNKKTPYDVQVRLGTVTHNATMLLLSRGRPALLSRICLRRTYASTSTNEPLKLAYELFEPDKPVASPKGPIIFLHGLFGSKRNNRTMSKCALLSAQFVAPKTSDTLPES